MLLYEGKAKQVYTTDNENEYIVYYKDDATAFNGEKKASIASSSKSTLYPLITFLNERYWWNKNIAFVASTTTFNGWWQCILPNIWKFLCT